MATKRKKSNRKPRGTRPNKSTEIANRPLDYFMHIPADTAGIEELSRMLNTLKRGAMARGQQFKKLGKFSYAYDALKRNIRDPKRKMSGMPASAIKKKYATGAEPGTPEYGKQLARQRNALLLDIFTYREFFLSETSTIEGIEAVNRRQDIEAFGKDRFGDPRRTMSEAERKKYWEVWKEFENYTANHPKRYEEGRLWIGSVMRQTSVLTDSDIEYIAQALGKPRPLFLTYAEDKRSNQYLSTKALWYGEEREEYEEYFKSHKKEVLERLGSTRGITRGRNPYHR